MVNAALTRWGPVSFKEMKMNLAAMQHAAQGTPCKSVEESELAQFVNHQPDKCYGFLST